MARPAQADETWLFVVEWYDPMPQLKRKYLLKYFVKQNQAEMVDIKSKKLFLKKSPCPPELTPEEFFIGGKVLIYSRELEIVDFGDETTRNRLQTQIQQTVAIMTPDWTAEWGKVLDAILSTSGFNLISLRSYQFPQSVADSVCGIFNISSRAKSNLLSSGVSLVLVSQQEDGINRLLDLAEPLMKEYGRDLMVSRSGTDVAALLDVLSTSRVPNSSTLDSCTCCVIKPHAVKARQVGQILDMILSQGYDVSAVNSFHMDKLQAEEFLEVYKGVVPEYADHVLQMSAGLAVALEVRAEDAVPTFRQTAGPWDVQMAKELRPGTIRAVYGIDSIRNAVHCTDLDSDGVTECEYCFRIL